MLWFEGSVPSAIASSKEKNCVFVVFIKGDDEQSTEMVSTWENARVVEAARDSFVAIKVDAKSESCTQFSQIYPVVCIPSSFFIGGNGIPLEVIAGSVPVEELIKRIEKVKQMHTEKVQQHEGNESSTASLHSQETASSVSQEETIENRSLQLESTYDNSESSKIAASDSSRDNGICSGQVSPAEVSISSDEASQLEDDLSVKVERLTKKLEARRELKKKDEEENEIKKEIERRKLGKEMLEFKKKQEGEKTKRMLEERNREKAEEKAARDRVKQQIALDRVERAARYAKTKEEVEAAKAAALEARQAELDARREAAAKERSTIARIQFRLPDGSFVTNQFPSESRLEEARQFVAQEVGNKYGNFSLATMFPRREFTMEDLNKTLLDLELVPSASVVLLPQTGRPSTSVVQSSGGGIWVFLGTIIYPLLAVWKFITSFLLASTPSTVSSTRQTSQSTNSQAMASNTTEPKRENMRKRILEKRTEDFKRDGKIYRLRTQEDNEDDNNTWNGNSTQQM
ncbi:UBX domain-containing protein 4 [Erpetoichthys calabaricus]|uniref:UBX domain-containing protein 4 n=1 Tax=Erpetoichthys calabaricus TaxID=27687 RepID=UPI0022342BE5|nr:UBX domain-containing protein 4 [Erpetoichthys calabaricus]